MSEKEDVNKMSMMNLATVFGPSLLRPPVAGEGHDGPTIDISQEVVIQVGGKQKRSMNSMKTDMWKNPSDQTQSYYLFRLLVFSYMEEKC